MADTDLVMRWTVEVPCKALFASLPDLPDVDHKAPEWVEERSDVKEVAKKVAAFLAGLNLGWKDPYIDDLTERFGYADRLYEIRDLWDELYDWADREGVWLDQNK